MTTIWAGQWHSKNTLDGETRHILFENFLPVLFHTRRECREYIKEKYGYIKDREDLRSEPHGWRVPKAIRVVITEARNE
mgnify:CR=1 FL=1